MSNYSRITCYFDERSELAKDTYNKIVNKYPMIGCRTDNQFDQDTHNGKELVITLGGDGVILKALHLFAGLNLDLYGINLGSVGFLLNDLDLDNLLTKIEEAIPTPLSPLEVRVEKKGGEVEKALAFNEVSLLRYTSQTAKLAIYINGKIRLEELAGDGIMVATPAGSTAYNAAASGPILPLKANILLLTPINPFRPRKLSSILLSKNSLVTIEILEVEKRPIKVFADSHEINKAKRVEVYERSDIKVSVLFDKNLSLDERILKEQFER
jgi:NAD+ kinase